ncbi:type II toxin-antitoxin system HicA family toxin [Algoriphagus algorifonticola]|uniref:type II toxin-antitoxin system HicA family toxin n=1 Tax=Algoriphagus algorifonticola TaxID=2593007 RepID=UPI0011A84D5E|nr:type II toxin-antitoxin system HicA family toxin [Algoriphagus algorifonticola]
MTQLDKLKARFLSNPKNFSFEELEKLLSQLGFEEKKLGKTAGSRKAFFHKELNLIIRLHKPHPSPILKSYMIKEIVSLLKSNDLL